MILKVAICVDSSGSCMGSAEEEIEQHPNMCIWLGEDLPDWFL